MKIRHFFSAALASALMIADRAIPESVLNGSAKVEVTGILALYQGKIQMVVNDISDIKVVE